MILKVFILNLRMYMYNVIKLTYVYLLLQRHLTYVYVQCYLKLAAHEDIRWHCMKACARVFFALHLFFMLIFRWAAASNDISLNAMIFPVALYFWQIPHFMALTYLCRDDLLEARVCSYIFVYSDNFFSYNYFGAL